MRLVLLFPLFFVLGCDDSSSSGTRRDRSGSDKKEESSPETEREEKPVRLRGKIRVTLAAAAHPADLAFAQGYQVAKRRDAGSILEYRKEEGDETSYFTARVRTEANAGDALGYYERQAQKYLDGGDHIKTELPDIGEGAIEGIAKEKSNSHLFMHVGPLFLELRGEVPSEILRLFAKEYAESMQTSLDTHLE